ncbi:VC0807 family protein [Chitinimonas sp.]|uniref:VC0807 family protein n=1 Tax=Chitinimonas sp. TaxID=1934313 RepID=UPI0035B21890
MKLPALKSWLWLDLLVSAVLPWLVYQGLQPRYGEWIALWGSAIPPALLAVIELAWRRRVDVISGLSLAGIALGLLFVAMGGDARMVLVRESALTGALGLLGLSSLFWRRPALYYLARAAVGRGDAQRAAGFEQAATQPAFRQAMLGLTLIWSAGLVAEALLRGLLAWRLSVADFLLYSPVVQYGSFALMFAATLLYRKRMQRGLAGVPA